MNETEEQKPFTKQTNISSNPTSVQENISAEPQANRKPVYEPVITRRTPPAVTTQIVERVSLKSILLLKILILIQSLCRIQFEH